MLTPLYVFFYAFFMLFYARFFLLTIDIHLDRQLLITKQKQKKLFMLLCCITYIINIYVASGTSTTPQHKHIPTVFLVFILQNIILCFCIFFMVGKISPGKQKQAEYFP